MSTGERIKAFREKANLTQKQLGALCGMQDSAIRRYESGRGNPTEKTLRRIADALKISLDDLISEKIEIVPGLDIIRTDNPNSDFYGYKVEAVNEELLSFGIQLLQNGGIDIRLYSLGGQIMLALSKLNEKGLELALEYLNALVKNPSLQKQDGEEGGFMFEGKKEGADGLDT